MTKKFCQLSTRDSPQETARPRVDAGKRIEEREKIIMTRCRASEYNHSTDNRRRK